MGNCCRLNYHQQFRTHTLTNVSKIIFTLVGLYSRNHKIFPPDSHFLHVALSSQTNIVVESCSVLHTVNVLLD